MPNKDLGSDKSKLCTYLKSVLRVQKEQILIMIMTCMAGFEKSTGKNNTFFAVMKYFLMFEYQYFGTISTYFTTGSWEARRRRRILTKDIRTGFQDPAFSLLRKHLSKYWRLGVTIQCWLLATFTLEGYPLQYFQPDLKEQSSIIESRLQWMI